MTNNATKNSKSNVYEQTARPADQKKWLAEQLKELAPRILCVVPGNHEKRTLREVDDEPLYDVACKLDIEHLYRPNAAFIFITLGEHKGGRIFYSMCVQHGSGGGTLLGAGLSASERFSNAIDGLDVYISGHIHKNAAGKPAKIVIDPQNKKISFRPVLIMVSKPWQEYGGYVLEKRLLPTYSGDDQIIRLSGSEKRFTATI